MRKIAAAFLSLLLSVVIDSKSYAQGYPEVTPPAPEAASVFKFVEVPVTHYSGLPSISVPLYEIELKHMSIPIQLNYHSRGIQVAEIAPRVGLGWALNYGGMISRQIRDKADDLASGYMHQSYYNDVFNNSSLRASMYSSYVSNQIDMVPDQFFFDMNGTNGKFVFDQVANEFLLQKFSDLKITPVMGETPGGSGILGWIVVDVNGTIYYYGLSKDGLRTAVDYDELINSNVYSKLNGLTVLGNDGDDRAINTWHLMEIETPFNEVVHFFYEEETSLLYRRSYDKLEGSDVLCYFSQVRSHQHQISSIMFNNGAITFIPSTSEREDLNGAYVLAEVEVRNNNDEVVKEYALQYYYTTSPNDNNQLPYLKTIEPAANKRLFLESVQEKGRTGEALPPYSFEYNATLLPNRFSNAQDAWGYYNGANNGNYLSFFNYSSTSINREVNSTFSEAGLLISVTKPTGGSVSFTYEQNIAIPPPFMNQLLYSPTTTTEMEEILEGFLKHPNYYSNGVYSKEITIGPNLVGVVDFSIDLPYCPGPWQDDPSYCHYEVYLRGQGNDLYLYPPDRNKVLNLMPGTYSLEVIPPSGHDPGAFENLFVVNLEWQEQITLLEGDSTSTGSTPLMAAGKRVKKIEYKDENGTVVTKEFSYEDSNGQTTGEIFGLPAFYYITSSVGPYNLVDKYGSRPGSPLTNLQGNSVGYSQVTEYQGTSLLNQGKTVYQFTTTEDGGDYYKFPYHIPIDNEWLRGKNLSTDIFENSAGVYELIKRVENSYLYADIPGQQNIFMEPFLPAGSNHVYSHTRRNFYLPLLVFTTDSNDFKTYYITGGTFDLHSTTETQFEEGIPKLEIQTVYRYNYDNHYLLAGSEKTASDGSMEMTSISYPQDYPSGTPFLDNMKALNLLAYPIEQISYREEQGVYGILSGKLTKFDEENPALSENLFLLESPEAIPLANFKFSNKTIGTLPLAGSDSPFLPDSRYTERLTYDLYDEHGNLLQITKSNDMPIAYIWGYNGQYPVAEVKNALVDDIAYTSFEDESGYWNYSGPASFDETAPTGKRVYSLNGGAITRSSLNTEKKYWLTYWVKSSSSPTVTSSQGSIGISAPQALLENGGWTLFRREISNTPDISINGNVLIDELRLYPVDAVMTTYTYDPLVGVTSITDANSLPTYYEYDGFNRLKKVGDHNGNIVKTYSYHFRNQP